MKGGRTAGKLDFESDSTSFRQWYVAFEPNAPDRQIMDVSIDEFA